MSQQSEPKKWLSIEEFYRLRGNTLIVVTDKHKYLKPNADGLLKSDIERFLADEMFYFHLDKKPWNGFTDHMEQRKDYMIGLLLKNPKIQMVKSGN